MTYFTELLWANVISYMGSLKEVEYHLTSGVYVLPSAVPSRQYITLNKYKNHQPTGELCVVIGVF